MDNSKLKRYSLSRQISDKLEHMIESGKFEVDTKIPSETELMEFFGVSRNTLREAIQSLILAGVLEAKQGDGTYVRSKSRFMANINHKLSQSSIKDINEARGALELTIIALSCLRRTDEDLIKITRAYNKRKRLNESAKEDSEADVEFHMALADGCHNDILIQLYNSFAFHLSHHVFIRTENTRMTNEQIETMHEELYEAVCEKDVQKAQFAISEIFTI